jgi:hypothetical protein
MCTACSDSVNKPCALPTQFVYLFSMILTINGDYNWLVFVKDGQYALWIKNFFSAQLSRYSD